MKSKAIQARLRAADPLNDFGIDFERGIAVHEDIDLAAVEGHAESVNNFGLSGT
jgi:hypothetical protein